MVTCNCQPMGTTPGEVTLAMDTIVIRHEVNLNRILQVLPGAHVEIEAGGILHQPGDGVRVMGGTFTSNGQIVTQSVEVQPGGSLIVNNYMQLMGGGVNNLGYFHLNNHVASVDIPANGSAEILNGEFFNGGTLIIGSNSCVNMGGNSFENASGGSVSGAGYVYTTGAIINNGSWGANTDWCAGAQQGVMPMPLADCSRGTCSGPQNMVRDQLIEERDMAFIHNQNEQVQVFPNPFKDSFTLQLNRNLIEMGATVSLLDLNGRVLLSRTVSPGQTLVTLNPKDLSNGFYLVNIMLENGEVHRMKVQQVR